MDDWDNVDLVPNAEIVSLIDTVKRNSERILQLENHIGSISNIVTASKASLEGIGNTVNSLIHDMKRNEKDLKAYMRLKNTVNNVIKKWEERIKQVPFQ